MHDIRRRTVDRSGDGVQMDAMIRTWAVFRLQRCEVQSRFCVAQIEHRTKLSFHRASCCAADSQIRRSRHKQTGAIVVEDLRHSEIQVAQRILNRDTGTGHISGYQFTDAAGQGVSAICTEKKKWT